MQVETAIAQSLPVKGKGDARTIDISLALLESLIDSVLDAGTPALANPYLTALFQKAAREVLQSAAAAGKELRVSMTLSTLL